MRVFAAEWAYRGRRGEGLEGTIIYGVGMVGLLGRVEVWEWVWLGGGRCVCLWDSLRSVFDMVEGRVGLVGVELTREWSWVGWM